MRKYYNKKMKDPLTVGQNMFLALLLLLGLIGVYVILKFTTQTPAQVYEECVKQIPSEVITLDMYQAQISACLQISQLASSTNL